MQRSCSPRTQFSGSLWSLGFLASMKNLSLGWWICVFLTWRRNSLASFRTRVHACRNWSFCPSCFSWQTERHLIGVENAAHRPRAPVSKAHEKRSNSIRGTSFSNNYMICLFDPTFTRGRKAKQKRSLMELVLFMELMSRSIFDMDKFVQSILSRSKRFSLFWFSLFRIWLTENTFYTSTVQRQLKKTLHRVKITLQPYLAELATNRVTKLKSVTLSSKNSFEHKWVTNQIHTK